MEAVWASYAYSDALYYLFAPWILMRWLVIAALTTFERAMLWPFILLRRIALYPAALVEFSAGLTAVFFSVAMAFDAGGQRGSTMAQQLHHPLWLIIFFGVGSMQMWTSDKPRRSQRAQTNAVAMALWITVSALMLIRHGIIAAHGLFLGLIFMSLISVLLLLDGDDHGRTPQQRSD